MTDPQEKPPLTSLAVFTDQLRFRWQAQDPDMLFPDIRLASGDHLFIEGPSGAGKSSLLSLLAGLTLPRSGQLELLGHKPCTMSAGRRDQFRADYLGVIFQQFNLVPYLSTLDNVLLPCKLSSRRRSRSGSPPQSAQTLLARLGLAESLWSRPVTRLSVGQQQRVAAARALIGAPGLILADEPTSALDTRNRNRFMELLLYLAEEHGSSVVFVSHDPSLASLFNNRLELEVSP